MKKLLFIYLIIGLILNISFLFAGWISFFENIGTEPIINILCTNDNSVTIEVTIPGIDTTFISTNDTSYCCINIPGCFPKTDYGFPELPTILKLLPVPSYGNYEITKIDSDLIFIDSVLIYPYIQDAFEDDSSEFYINNDIYSDSAYYPQYSVTLDSARIWRDIRVSCMNYSPIKYLPNSGKLKVYKYFKYKVTYADISDYNQYVRSSKINDEWDGIYNLNVLNYSNIINYDYITTSTSTTDYDYLIIVIDDLFPEIEAFSKWKTQKGLLTKTYKLSDVVSENSSSPYSEIYEFICNEYNNSNIKYVLFVGTLYQIPSYNCKGDYLYSVLNNKKGYYADLAVGRFPVTTKDELKNMIDKSIYYEDNPEIGNLNKKVILVHGPDNNNNKHYKNLISIQNFQYANTVDFDFLYNPYDEEIISKINFGCNSVLYQGHGNYSYWENKIEAENFEVNFDYSDAHSLTSDRKNPIIFAYSCYTGGSSAENSICDEFAVTRNGSVAYFGCLDQSHNKRNDVQASWTYRIAYDTDDTVSKSIGDITNSAAIYAIYSAKALFMKKNATKYRWLGDASLKMWTNSIQEFSNPSFICNSSSIEISLAENCNICVVSSDNASSYYKYITNNNSYIFTNTDIGSPLYITITKQNYLPKQFLTGGTFLENQHWYGNIKLLGDVSISSGDTLFIKKYSSIDLNGHSITSSGGIICIENESQLYPDIRLMNGTTVTGYYPTISSAFAAGSVVEVRNEYVSTDNIEIGGRKTLKPQPGSELKFASGKYLGVLSLGNLTADGATFTSSSGTWNGIKYYSGSNGSLSNCTIENALFGVRLNTHRTVENCTINNCSKGIYCNNSSPTIDNCVISGLGNPYGIYNYYASPTIINDSISTEYGVYNYNSTPKMRNNNITSEFIGLYCDDHSSPILASIENGDGDNYFHTGAPGWGVYADDNSNPVLGFTNCEAYGNNSFVYSFVEGIVYAGTNCSIMAEHCWWGGTPSASLFTGNVDYTPWLTSMPMYSFQAPSPENNLYDSRMMLSSTIPGEEASEDLTRYYNKQWDLAKKIEFIRYAYMLGEAKGVAGLCKDIISENPYKPEAFAALDMIYQISKNENIKKDFDKDMLKSYLKTFENSKSNQYLKADAMLLLAGLEKDVNLMDRVYKEHKNTYVGKYALHQKFMYCFHEAEDTVAARTVLNEMDEVYPDEAVTYESHVLMGDEVMDPKEFYSQYHKKNNPESIQSMPTDISEILPEEYALNAAYPNPFNPSMTLEYALPTQSDVKCSIYNVSGSLVKEYNFSQNAGTYSIVWNASNVSSGIYLIRFTAEAEDGSESFVDYQKVTLLK